MRQGDETEGLFARQDAHDFLLKLKTSDQPTAALQRLLKAMIYRRQCRQRRRYCRARLMAQHGLDQTRQRRFSEPALLLPLLDQRQDRSGWGCQ